MKPDIKAIRDRESKATPGPWRVVEKGNTVKSVAVTTFAVAWNPQEIICPNMSPKTGNADFIAHARTDIPALLAYITELETALEAANDRNTFTECEVRDGQAFCPACGEEVAGYYSDYCEHCGQALSLPPEE